MKERIWERFGKKMDLDSSKELTAALKDHLDLAAAIGAKSLSLRLLEELAIPHRDVRHIVEYKRMRKQLKRIESIAAAAKGKQGVSVVQPGTIIIRSSFLIGPESV